MILKVYSNTRNFRVDKGFYYTKNWKKLRRVMYSIFPRKCMKCNCTKTKMHVDHIIPRSIDITKSLDIRNLQILCQYCNLSKGNTSTSDYRTKEDIEKVRVATRDKYSFVKKIDEIYRSKLKKEIIKITRDEKIRKRLSSEEDRARLTRQGVKVKPMPMPKEWKPITTRGSGVKIILRKNK